MSLKNYRELLRVREPLQGVYPQNRTMFRLILTIFCGVLVVTLPLFMLQNINV